MDSYSKAVEYVMARNGGNCRRKTDTMQDSLAGYRNFTRPVGVEVYPGDRIIVTDACGRLVVYDKEKDYVAPA